MKYFYKFIIINFLNLLPIFLVIKIFKLNILKYINVIFVYFFYLIFLSLIFLTFSKKIYLYLKKAKILSEPKSKKENLIFKIVEEYSKKFKIKNPKLAFYKSNTNNSFSLGCNMNNSLIVLSDNLIKKANYKEIETIIVYEIINISSKYSKIILLIQNSLNFQNLYISLAISKILTLFSRKNKKKKKYIYYNLLYNLINYTFSLFSSIYAFHISRKIKLKLFYNTSKIVGEKNILHLIKSYNYSSDNTREDIKMIYLFYKNNKFFNLMYPHPTNRKIIRLIKD
ncbi:MAG: M48 family metalloprotease [Enterobacteriaceae bacterium]